MLFIETSRNIIDDPIEDYQIINHNSNNLIDGVLPNKLYIGNTNSNNMC